MCRALLFFVLLTWSVPLFVAAQAGTLDKSFGNEGIVFTSRDTLTNYNQRAVVVQPDGKIVVGGDIRGNLNGMTAWRYLSDGSPDPAFGSEGQVITNLIYPAGNSVALQKDGKIVVAGFSSSGGSLYTMVRYNENGSQDSSFGVNGIVVANGSHSYYDGENDIMLLQPDGKILLAGTSEDNSYPFPEVIVMMRFNENGTLDTTFNHSGILNYGYNYNSYYYSNTECFSMVLQPDNKIIVGGETLDHDLFDRQLILLRININGTVDSTFGLSGAATISKIDGHYIGYCHALAIQYDNKIMAIGTANQGICILRFNPDGVIDSSFDTQGIAIDTASGLSFLNTGLMQPDGKIIAEGETTDGYTNYFALSRYNIDGSLDSTFGNNGIDVEFSDDPPTIESAAYGLALQADSKILAVGTWEKITGNANRGALIRYLGDLNTDVINLTFGKTLNYLYPNPLTGNIATLKYELLEKQFISLTLLNENGEQMTTFIRHQMRNAGIQTEVLNFSASLSLGIYFLKLETEHGNVCIKISRM